MSWRPYIVGAYRQHLGMDIHLYSVIPHWQLLHQRHLTVILIRCDKVLQYPTLSLQIPLKLCK